ncbi:hypothetical protein FC24_GL000276 [Loigolactobacillus rennini DSM 20253]|uniref:GrdX protein n=1 Tax=Loigolactobacillus rennini DSM 20253 TaxID=1423796 RepID=A0A0R2D4G2_9LACO|nr:hypothetical protein FC24_GL000276 [Loigolactobacillus rennini DSM 20253]
MFIDGAYADVLASVKKAVIDKHWTLLTHPLSGSLKPNETYYRTVFLDNTHLQYIDMQSLEYIEAAIRVYDKFMRDKPRPQWPAKVLADFAFIDFDIAQSTLQRMGQDATRLTKGGGS